MKMGMPFMVASGISVALIVSLAVFISLPSAPAVPLMKGDVTYFWDFGDGATSVGFAPRHVYQEAGEYEVTFKMVDSEGNTYLQKYFVDAEAGEALNSRIVAVSDTCPGGATCPPCPEKCFDGIDNDGNGLVDCSDPVCSSLPAEAICYDLIDNDCDGLIDCGDLDCALDPICIQKPKTEANCNDGIDNDGDGLVDCLDPDCNCFYEVNCVDYIDNDFDGLIDCADPDCIGGIELICNDLKDNDCDGLIDCLDPDCIAAGGCTEDTQELCHDGLDNDGDGLIDCADPDCINVGPEDCTNNKDDDCDKFIDCQDSDCATHPNCAVGPGPGPGPVVPVCGDGKCEPPESYTNCCMDCPCPPPCICEFPFPPGHCIMPDGSPCIH